MDREYISTEFNCRRMSVIVHRSAGDRLAVDSLVCIGKFTCNCLWTESYSRKEFCVWQIVSNQRFVNNKLLSGELSQVFIYTQLYAPYNFIRA